MQSSTRRRNRPVVTIIQPYVPDYRVPVFDALSRQLDEVGYELQVLHGAPEGAQAERGDARAGTWSREIRVRRLRLAGYVLHYRSVVGAARKSSVVIAELASTNLDTYLLALFIPRRLGLWGHGKSYVTEASPLDSRLELWLARRARRVFVYTQGGADYLQSMDLPSDRITVVRNSTDTVALRAAAQALTGEEVDAFREELDLGDGPVAAFVGGYDESKLLPLLFEAAQLVHAQLPSFRLIVAGAGNQQAVVDDATRRLSCVRARPRADAAALARIGAVADCVVMPGRVGLVAVDALALGLPVVTTTYPYHAPEYEYLDDEVKVVTGATPDELAGGMIELLTEPQRLARGKAAARRLREQFSAQQMAAAFTDALIAMTRDSLSGRNGGAQT